MKKTIKRVQVMVLTAFMLTAGTSGIYAQKLKGDGNVVSQNREVSGFTQLEVSGIISMKLKQGNEEGVKVTTDSNLQEHVITRVSGNTLKVSTKEDIKDVTELEVVVTASDLKRIGISGAVKFETDGAFKASMIELDCSGASKVSAEFISRTIEGDLSGGSKIELRGSTDLLELDVSGATSIQAFDLKANTCEMDVSGAAKAEIYCNERLEAEISGAAKIVYKGDPEVEKSVSGVASIDAY
jgi:hypothetical protein